MNYLSNKKMTALRICRTLVMAVVLILVAGLAHAESLGAGRRCAYRRGFQLR